MTEIHIDSATNGQLDYAVAVAMGWTDNNDWSIPMFNCNGDFGLDSIPKQGWKPTTDQAQCFDLIQKFKVMCEWNAESGDSKPAYLDMWYCNVYKCCFFDTNESLNIAVVKAVLLSKFPNCMIPTKED
jgi:hypothetical protein